MRYFNEEAHTHLVARGALYVRRTIADPNTGERETFDIYRHGGEVLYFDHTGHMVVTVWDRV